MGDRQVVRDLTCASAFHQGTNLRLAIKTDQGPIRAWLALEVTKLVRAVGVNNTLSDTEEVLDTCDAIIDEFPALTMEEIAYVFRQIKRGHMLPKLYGQLRMRQILEAFRMYEGQERADMLERHHQEQTKANNAASRIPRMSGRRERPEHISLTEEDHKNLGTWRAD